MRRGVYTILILAVVVSTSAAFGEAVPRYLNYQAVLYDSGGNVIPDGTRKVYLRLMDASGGVVYEEVQSAEIVGGVVSLIVGDGSDVGTGRPTGGVDPNIFIKDSPLYLEVEVEGYPPEPPAEVVSVPYALISQVAEGVIEGGIDERSIATSAILPRHLSEEALSYIADEMVERTSSKLVSKEELDAFKALVSGEGGALNIGIGANFSYSSATNLGDLLKDLDTAIKKREEDIRWEGSTRKSEDQRLSLSIAAEANARAAADASINSSIAAEANARAAADTNINSKLDAHMSDTNNPHHVTPSQIGAVSTQELYNQQGYIKEPLLPPTVVMENELSQNLSPRLLVKGRIYAGTWDDAYTSDSCFRYKQECTVGGCTDTVVCLLSSGTEECSMKRLILPEFSISSPCGMPSHGGDEPYNHDSPLPESIFASEPIHTLSRYRDRLTNVEHCNEIITFKLKYDMCIPIGSNGPDIRWAFYEVPIVE